MQDAASFNPSFNPLGSAQWHRVADVCPRLAEQVQVTRQWVRGQRWHVLMDPRTGRSCRLNASAWDVAARLDGRRSLQALWALLDAHHAGHDARHDAGQPDPAQADAHVNDPPSQDEVLAVVRELHRHHLLQFEGTPDFGALATPVAGAQGPQDASHNAATDTASAHGRQRSLLSWRMRLIDPSPWLQRATPWAHRLFSSAGLMVWCAAMLALLAGMLLHGSALRAHAAAWMQTPRYLLIAALCYPVMKALHEAAHALAVRRWGGQVHEAGITWMMLMPVPYVDASAAHGFGRAWQRAMVSAAGIMTELMLAAIGLWLWQGTEPGLLHDIGFVMWFVGAVSTVMFNANPLQRLDGYHLLTDALHLPNLAGRSRQWWQTTVSHWLQAGHSPAQVNHAPPASGEKPWLVAYAPLSWLFQCGLMAGLTWWLGGVASWLGWALGLASVWTCAIAPARRWLQVLWQAWLWSGPQQGATRWRVIGLLSLPVLLALPWPDRTLVQGVVWAPDEALVRPQTEGMVQTVHRADGAAVQAGDVLVMLHNPSLMAQRERILAQLAQAEQGSFGFLGEERGQNLGKAGQAGDAVLRWQAELQEVQARIDALQVRAARAGRLVLPGAQDLPGRYLKRGVLLGHVLDATPPRVRLAVQVDEVKDLRKDTRSVSVAWRAPDVPTLPATLLRDSIGATRELPSAALSADMGGEILTDPQDDKHVRTLKPVVLMDVTVDAANTRSLDHTRLGERVWVRFDRGWAPLPWQAWRWVQRRAMADFNPRQ
ncbi:MAG: hypothetical protein QM742_12720 [Aquabacterium sp.]